MRPSAVLLAAAGVAATALLVRDKRKGHRKKKAEESVIVRDLQSDSQDVAFENSQVVICESTQVRTQVQFPDPPQETSSFESLESDRGVVSEAEDETLGGGRSFERAWKENDTLQEEDSLVLSSEGGKDLIEGALRCRTGGKERNGTALTLDTGTPDEEEDVWEGHEVECSRSLGAVEENWVRGVSSGTGVCIVMIVIARQVAPWQVRHAARELQRRHAMLRSWIVFDKNGKPRFEVVKQPYLEERVGTVRIGLDGGVEFRAVGEGGMETREAAQVPALGVELAGGENGAKNVASETGVGDSAILDWHHVLERELNTPVERVTVPPGKSSGGLDPLEERLPALAVKLHFLPGGRCAVALRVHTATCDYAAVALVAGEFVNLLDQVVAQTDEQILTGGVLTPPRGMKRVFSNAGMHQEDEWQFEPTPGGGKMRRAVSSHKLHGAGGEILAGGMRKVQSEAHLDRGGFGSFAMVAPPDGGEKLRQKKGGGAGSRKPLKFQAESPNSPLEHPPLSSSTSASSLIPDRDSHTIASSFSRVPTENGKPLYDPAEFPPLRNPPPGPEFPGLKPVKVNGNLNGSSPPMSPSFSSPMSFASARSLPLSPWASPALSPSASFAKLSLNGGVESISPAPPPSPLSSCGSFNERVAMGLIDPFAELGSHANPPPRSGGYNINITSAYSPLDNKKPAHISIGPFEYLTRGSDALPCVEDLVDKNRAKKPFWAKGKDLVGYSVGSLGKPLLSFQPGWTTPFQTQVVYSIIPQAATQALLAACTAHDTTLYGALTASCFKAVAASKKIGPCPEIYGITTMVNCRTELRTRLEDCDVGFLHSALMHHHSVAESTELWELAGRCSATLEQALKEDKQFKDMGVLNMLFYQAMQHPNLTPQSSLRTSVLSAFCSSVHVPLPTTSTLELTDFIGCASVHGVGPCIGIFSFMINGNLHYCLAFPVPLFSREQVGWVNERMRESLMSCAESASAEWI